MSIQERIPQLWSSTQRTISQWLRKLWSITGAFTVLQRFLPPEVSLILRTFFLYRVGTFFNLYTEMKIAEFNATDDYYNALYIAAEEYLQKLQSVIRARKLIVCDVKIGGANVPELIPDYGEVVRDSFNGVTVWWSITKSSETIMRQTPTESNLITLKVNNGNRNFFEAYIAHIERNTSGFNREDGSTLFFNTSDWWEPFDFSHPSTFDTLALDPKLKDTILMDLNRFKESKEFYRRIGRAWKRGYILYGPPGTGKTTLIAAIANYMKYNIFELQLSNVYSNNTLRKLIRKTWAKSIIIIDDKDCNSLSLSNRGDDTDSDEESGNKLTLSALLNAIDGLQSCLTEERIFIFTTNDKDLLDPALLRPGRMDLHISLSFCNFPAFKTLAKNYLKVENHGLFAAVKEKIECGAEMTPAEIISVITDKVKDPVKALNAVISAMDAKINQKEILQARQLNPEKEAEKDEVKLK